MEKIPVVLLLLLSAASVVSGDYLAKVWSLNQKPAFLFAAIFTYLLSGIFYIPTLLREGLVITSLIWSLLSIMGFTLLGLILFHETLTTLQVVGLVLGVVALLILNI